MNVVTVNEAKRNLDSLIKKVFSDAEPTIITTDSGQQIVLLSLDEFNSLPNILMTAGLSKT